jgi:threonine aldolase
MRQAGVLAAAGLYALQHHVDRLREDHDNARELARGLREIGLDVEGPHTNMVFVRLSAEQSRALVEGLERDGILIGHSGRLRLVTHLDVSGADIATFVAAVQRLAVGRNHTPTTPP